VVVCGPEIGGSLLPMQPVNDDAVMAAANTAAARRVTVGFPRII
jgi:hypothetical protein